MHGDNLNIPFWFQCLFCLSGKSGKFFQHIFDPTKLSLLYKRIAAIFFLGTKIIIKFVLLVCKKHIARSCEKMAATEFYSTDLSSSSGTKFNFSDVRLPPFPFFHANHMLQSLINERMCLFAFRMEGQGVLRFLLLLLLLLLGTFYFSLLLTFVSMLKWDSNF